MLDSNGICLALFQQPHLGVRLLTGYRQLLRLPRISVLHLILMSKGFSERLHTARSRIL